MQRDREIAAVEALERALLEPQIRSSRMELDCLLADEFVEFGQSGRQWTKSEILDALVNEAGLDVAVDSLHARHIGAGVILITYRTHRTNEASARHVYRSSIWQYQGVSWKLIFHQGTAAADIEA